MRCWSWIGLAAGFVLGLVDLALARVMGVQVGRGGEDWTVSTFLLFATTFAVLGWVAGRLAETLTALRASQRRAVENEKLASLGRAAAGVAHEVRNPLAVIRSSAALLLERAQAGDDEQLKAARFIVDEVDRLDGFLRRLLDFSRPLVPARRRTDIGGLLERVRTLAGGAIEVETAIGEHDVDADLLSQALLSMALNAREAAARIGSVTLPKDWTQTAPHGHTRQANRALQAPFACEALG
ncbi:MAG TPA: histidine kinase dimerization/phospho-acceptor domain-containing protein [Thermoanaerobaculia bacterium]|nr:histidine kinase dimerization/phospho-acceptor domain-containing protein [Thermoanaerobaculia bacterium]